LGRFFDTAAVSRSLHLVPIAASVTLEIGFLPTGQSLFDLDSSYTTFMLAMFALTSQRSAVFLVCALFASGVFGFCLGS
jgi:hypothetical protein